MTTRMISQERLAALENLEEVARGIERRLSGPYQLSRLPRRHRYVFP